MQNIIHAIPWNTSKNIGKSYNEIINLIQENDWVCFLDGDAVHTTNFFGSRIEETVCNNPDYSMFTCYTNRVWCSWQIAPDVDIASNDQKYHREFGESLWQKNQTKVIDVTFEKDPMSGVLVLINKKTWKIVGGFIEQGMMTVDNDMFYKIRKNNMKTGLMTGIYVQHWYRNGDNRNREHFL